MKLLIIISSRTFDEQWCHHIKILDDYMKNTGLEVEYCGISSEDDFDNYETIIQFKYKMINTKQQLDKMCDFISEYKSQLDYDWYMKFRPEFKLLENIAFDTLSENAINARARVYNGPRKIKYGMPINGEGYWKNIGDCHYAEIEHDIVLDDVFYIFHKNIIEQNAFEKLPPSTAQQHEWEHARVFNERKIQFNVIGINAWLGKHETFPGDINM